MSYLVTAMVRAARLPRSVPRWLRPSLKGVLLSIADRADDYGEGAYPAVATMAAEAEIGPRTTDERLRILMKPPLSVISEQAPPTQHFPRTYRLHLDVIASWFDGQFYKRYAQLADRLAKAGPQHVAYLPERPGSPPEVAAVAPEAQPQGARVAECGGQSRNITPPGSQHVADELLNRMNRTENRTTTGAAKSAPAAPSLRSEIPIPTKPRHHATEPAADGNYRVVLKLANEVLDELGDDAPLGDIAEAIKCKCAKAQIAYDSDLVARAIASAGARRRLFQSSRAVAR